MDLHRPASAAELASALREAAAAGRVIRLSGNSSKDRMAGPPAESQTAITTCALRKVLQYEPKDLTISVQAGMPWAELSALLASNGQMIPLDPPFFSRATVGGVLAANASGPRRRLYGTPRDVVIGMEFATLEGKLVQSGGMVVKNVAGLDMGKLMIGSFGTLAAIASANFKLTPIPEASRTWACQSAGPADALFLRDRVLKGVLQPAAVDLLNPAASECVGLSGWNLLVQAGGVPSVLDRYDRELASGGTVRRLEDAEADDVWQAVRELIPGFLTAYPEGAVLRVSSTLQGLPGVLTAYASEPGAMLLSRAASGVTYVGLPDARAAKAGDRAVIEYRPAKGLPAEPQWQEPGSAFGVMRRIKDLFDPKGLLNPGRLYGRI